jgi:hypothetical protein
VRSELVGVAWLLGLGSSLALPPDRAAAEGGARRAAQQPAEAARAVVAAVVRAAEANARLPLRTERGAKPPFRRTGDDLTEFLVRAAAGAAKELPAEEAAGAFLLGVGLAIDDSTIIRNNPLTRALCRRVESDAERARRLAVLGAPTMRGRRDLAQHFVVSCALVEVVGAPLAEAAGLYKEQRDSRPGGSGFSFADLSADLAGVTLAVRLKKGTVPLETLAKQYRVDDYLPDPRGLREDLPAEQFAKDYGGLSDRRFLAEVEKIRGRIADLPAYRPVRRE